MARTASPLRLTPAQASDFRSEATKIRDLRGWTNSKIADETGLSYDQVTSAFNGARALQADRAAVILAGLGNGRCPAAAASAIFACRRNWDWLERYKASLNAPSAACVPFAELERFSEWLALEIASANGIGRAKRGAIATVIRRVLDPREKSGKSTVGGRVLRAWYETMGSSVQRAVREVENGRFTWADDLFPTFESAKPQHIAREAIWAAAVLAADGTPLVALPRKINSRRKVSG